MTPITLQQAYDQAVQASSKNCNILPTKVFFTVSEKGWSFKQLNPIQRLARRLFNAYPETHYKAIKAELDKLDDTISLRIKSSWHRAKDPLFQVALKTINEILNTFNVFNTEELLKNPNALENIKEDVASKFRLMKQTDFEKEPLYTLYHVIFGSFISVVIVDHLAKNLENPNSHQEIQFKILSHIMLMSFKKWLNKIGMAFEICQTEKPLAEILDELCHLFYVDRAVALVEWANEPGTAPETKKVINAILGDDFESSTTYLWLWQNAKETAPHIREKLQKILDMHEFEYRPFNESETWNNFKQKWGLNMPCASNISRLSCMRSRGAEA